MGFLDLNTIAIIGLVLHSALALAMLQTYLTRKTYPGFRCWTAGLVCWVLGSSGVFFRLYIGDLLALVLCSPLFYLFGILFHHGFIRFYALENSRRQLALDVAVACLGLGVVYGNALVLQSSNVRVCVNSLVGSFLLFRAALEPYLIPGTRRSNIQLSISLSLGLIAGLLLARSAMAAFGPHLPSMQFEDPMLRPVLVLGLVALVLTIYGFISLMHARLEEELLRAQARLREQANTDALTGLLNRRGFTEIAGHDIRSAVRYGHKVSLIMIDLDHFKEINDTHGHTVGDEVLAAVGRMCRKSMREVDIVARLGGEEFAVLMPQTDLASACRTAERLRQMLRCIWEIRGLCVSTSASFGVAELDPGGLDSMLNRADACLYRAKHEGRDRVCSEV